MAQTRLADAAQTFDHASLALILELELDRLRKFSFDRHIAHVAFLLQDVRDALLDFGVRHFDGRQQRALGIANPGQHVRNRISHKITSWLWLCPESIRSTRFRGTSAAS